MEDYTTGKQQSLMQMKKGQLGREAFLEEAARHIAAYYDLAQEGRERHRAPALSAPDFNKTTDSRPIEA